jgi:hypothetical protein
MDAFAALSELSKLGKKTEIVDINSLKLLLSTLDSEQEGYVFAACAEMVGNAYFLKLKSETLKYAIRAVNEQRLDEYETLIDADKREQVKNETLSKLEKIIGTWDENVISFLYSKWSALTKVAEKELKEKGLIE